MLAGGTLIVIHSGGHRLLGPSGALAHRLARLRPQAELTGGAKSGSHLNCAWRGVFIPAPLGFSPAQQRHGYRQW
eukprot:1107234-Heterocapsa_arctica.AAC.1